MFYMVNLITGWLSFFAGALSGAMIGLFFHKESWLGGYYSFSRRLLRLGHIAFFGIGLLNLMFVFSVQTFAASPYFDYASTAFLLSYSMSVICFLCAWKTNFRHLFFIPVLGVSSAIIFTTLGVVLS